MYKIMIPFIINLETSIERRENMMKLMNLHDIPYVIVNAISGLNLVEPEYRERVAKDLAIPEEKLRPTYYLSRTNFISLSDKWENLRGRVGCYLSHLKCFHIAVKYGYKTLCILEDDIEFNGDIGKIPEGDFDMIYLGGSVKKISKWDIEKGYYHCKDITLFGSYGIIIKGEDKILKIYNALKSVFTEGKRRLKYDKDERMSMSSIDNFYKRYFHDNSIVIYPPLVKHKDELKSTINNSKSYKNKYGLKCLSKLEPED